MTENEHLLKNQMDMLREIGEIKGDIGEIKGSLKQLIPRVNNLEKKTENKTTIFIATGAIVISCLSVVAKLLGLW